MGWKENKQKHKEFVDKVTDLLIGSTLVKEEDFVSNYVESTLLTKYGWRKDKDYQIKLISKRKNKYHFRAIPYSVVENIDIKIDISE